MYVLYVGQFNLNESALCKRSVRIENHKRVLSATLLLLLLLNGFFLFLLSLASIFLPFTWLDTHIPFLYLFLLSV